MGTLIGHAAHGFGFIFIGLWHLFNHVKLFSLHPKSYRNLPWFPFPKFRHLELLVIAVGTFISIGLELFNGYHRHHPLDVDLTIPSNHLRNFEHASITLTFLLYSSLAMAFDRASPALPAAEPLTILAASFAFAQQLFLFHLHSSGHMGVEGQYHLCFKLIISVSLITTIMGISHPRSFVVGFVRSTSIVFQGIWLVVMGYALWTPELIPKGCFIKEEEGPLVVRCSSEEALRRAKSLVNIEFSWIIAAVVACSMMFHLVLSRRYTEAAEYYKVVRGEEELRELRKGNDEEEP